MTSLAQADRSLTSVIVAGARTPAGTGSLKDFSGSDLGAITLHAALRKA